MPTPSRFQRSRSTSSYVAIRTSVLPKFLPCSRLAGWATAPADQKTGKPLDYDPNKDVQT
jgi:hypothetical protein